MLILFKLFSVNALIDRAKEQIESFRQYIRGDEIINEDEVNKRIAGICDFIYSFYLNSFGTFVLKFGNSVIRCIRYFQTGCSKGGKYVLIVLFL